jgi:hypothetical protein
MKLEKAGDLQRSWCLYSVVRMVKPMRLIGHIVLSKGMKRGKKNLGEETSWKMTTERKIILEKISELSYEYVNRVSLVSSLDVLSGSWVSGRSPSRAVQSQQRRCAPYAGSRTWSPRFMYCATYKDQIAMCHYYNNYNSAALVRKRTMPTERALLVSEVSANFCG